MILVLVEFDSRTNVTVEGLPRLGIRDRPVESGMADFLPWPDWPRPRWGQRSPVRGQLRPSGCGRHLESRPPPSTSPMERFVTVAGVEVEVEIYAGTPKHLDDEPAPVVELRRTPCLPCGDWPPESEGLHRPNGHTRSRTLHPPRCCSTSGTGPPSGSTLDEGIPASERADAEHFFGVAERLSERIEEQLGYSILEVAGWIPREPSAGSESAARTCEDCVGVRPGGIVATTVPGADPTIRGNGTRQLRPHCGVVFWTSDNVDTVGRFRRHAGPHEVFHLFGFGHSLGNDAPVHEAPRKAWVTRCPLRMTNMPLGSATDLGVDALKDVCFRCAASSRRAADAPAAARRPAPRRRLRRSDHVGRALLSGDSAADAAAGNASGSAPTKRERALNLPRTKILPREWDGTPLAAFDLFDHFHGDRGRGLPRSASLTRFPLLADRIEEQCRATGSSRPATSFRVRPRTCRTAGTSHGRDLRCEQWRTARCGLSACT